jgi:hypothetical protein
MTKESQSIIISLPRGSIAYAFGSWASNGDGQDADILIVYDPTVCDPSNAYAYHAGFVSQIESQIRLPIDLTLLTKAEEAQVGFVVHEGCVPLDAALKRRCEQVGAGQPATRLESKSKGSNEPQPEWTGRSR